MSTGPTHLCEVAEQHCNGVEAVEGCLPVLLELNACDELSQDDEVQDDGRSQQGVLTCVVQHNGVLTAQEDLTGVLIQGALAVTHIRHIPASETQQASRKSAHRHSM